MQHFSGRCPEITIALNNRVSAKPRRKVSMRRRMLPAMLIILGMAGLVPLVRAYVEAPYTLGRCVHESTHIVLVEVTKVNKEKNLIVYKKLQDIKGKHPKDEIKHNIGTRGFHP